MISQNRIPPQVQAQMGGFLQSPAGSSGNSGGIWSPQQWAQYRQPQTPSGPTTDTGLPPPQHMIPQMGLGGKMGAGMSGPGVQGMAPRTVFPQHPQAPGAANNAADGMHSIFSGGGAPSQGLGSPGFGSMSPSPVAASSQGQATSPVNGSTPVQPPPNYNPNYMNSQMNGLGYSGALQMNPSNGQAANSQFNQGTDKPGDINYGMGFNNMNDATQGVGQAMQFGLGGMGGQGPSPGSLGSAAMAQNTGGFQPKNMTGWSQGLGRVMV